MKKIDGIKSKRNKGTWLVFLAFKPPNNRTKNKGHTKIGILFMICNMIQPVDQKIFLNFVFKDLREINFEQTRELRLLQIIFINTVKKFEVEIPQNIPNRYQKLGGPKEVMLVGDYNHK